jgi:organic hydroperoxide reductase OsmC/OhrA
MYRWIEEAGKTLHEFIETTVTGIIKIVKNDDVHKSVTSLFTIPAAGLPIALGKKMKKTVQYRVHTRWESAAGTANNDYDRAHSVAVDHKPDMILTTANPLKGDPGKLNPEDLLVASVSSCHMLTYLYLCAAEGVVVTEYTDEAIGTLIETNPETTCINKVQLNPVVTVAEEGMVEIAIHLHHKAHNNCIIANSVKFEITTDPTCKVK